MIPLIRNDRGRRSLASEMPQPGSEQQAEPEDRDAGLELLLSWLRRQFHDSGYETLNDPGLADAMKQILGRSLADWAEVLGERVQDGQGREAESVNLAKARRLARSTLVEQMDVLSRRQEVEAILRTLELSNLRKALALSVARRDRSSEVAAAAARRSVEVAEALERIRETTGRLLESAAASQEATRLATVEAKRIAELRETVDALSRHTEELRRLVQQIRKDRLSGDGDVGFLGEPHRSLSACLADMLVLTPRPEPAEFDPSASAAFGATGNAMAGALLDSRARDEGRERRPSLPG